MTDADRENIVIKADGTQTDDVQDELMNVLGGEGVLQDLLNIVDHQEVPHEARLVLCIDWTTVAEVAREVGPEAAANPCHVRIPYEKEDGVVQALPTRCF